ncbi:Hypothetical predicted protein [Octopus vulgaris]|nr:Hypothetical predicted protein [Octopus vulgaris]
MQKYLILACCFLIFNAGRSQARRIEYDTISDSMSTTPRDIIGKNIAKIPDYATIPPDAYNKRSISKREVIASQYIQPWAIASSRESIDIPPNIPIRPNIPIHPNIPIRPDFPFRPRDIIGKNIAKIPDYATIPPDAYNKRSISNGDEAKI